MAVPLPMGYEAQARNVTIRKQESRSEQTAVRLAQGLGLAKSGYARGIVPADAFLLYI